MMAFSLIRMVPGWLYAVAVSFFIVLAGGVYERYQGAESVQKLWDADKADRAIADASAIADRITKNTVLATQQAADSAAIMKEHDAEINSLRARVADAPRLRIGAGFCSGVAASTDSQGTTSGAGDDPGSRVLSDELDGSVKTLILQSEMAAATGRACQEFLRDNGMAL